MEKDPFTSKIIGCAIEVHRELGPGLLESTYQQCLAHELTLNGLAFKLEHPLPVEYKGCRLDCGYRVDIMIENRVIIELKAIEEVKNITVQTMKKIDLFIRHMILFPCQL